MTRVCISMCMDPVLDAPMLIHMNEVHALVLLRNASVVGEKGGGGLINISMIARNSTLNKAAQADNVIHCCIGTTGQKKFLIFSANADKIAAAVVVLPVPGGPWINTQRSLWDRTNASIWRLFNLLILAWLCKRCSQL